MYKRKGRSLQYCIFFNNIICKEVSSPYTKIILSCKKNICKQ